VASSATAPSARPWFSTAGSTPNRAYNDQIFVDLRDRYGITQIVFEADDPTFQPAQEIRDEFVLSIKGTVRERLPGKHNPKLATGDVEVKVAGFEILNRCPTPPFPITEFPGEELAHEDLRLQYRFLDLRRLSLQRMLGLRHRLNQVIREHLDKHDFIEVETPLLGRSTPEGARDYLVPSRVTPESWYAAAAVAAALQAASHGGRLRQVLPNRPLSAR